MLHFLTNHAKIWRFGLPFILKSNAAHRWFYSERDYNKIDLIYRVQRQFNVKIILDEMFQQLYEELANEPYAASFFYAYVNQEYLDENIPEFGVLRKAISTITHYDLGMIHREIQGFQSLRNDIVKRHPNQTSYRDILDQYCKQIERFINDCIELEQGMDTLTNALMEEDIQTL